jgi:hypothetical protein
MYNIGMFYRRLILIILFWLHYWSYFVLSIQKVSLLA